MEKQKSDEPKVSIIVPVYNVERYIKQCVDSLIAQTYKNIEIILVDDGSPDKSPSFCNIFANIDSRIRVIHKPNEGASIARKSGLFEATGEYLLFVDSDDWIDSDTVSECVKTAIETDADCVMFGYAREYPDKSINNYLFEQDFSYDHELSEKRIHRRIVGLSEEELSNPQQVDNLSSVCMRLMRIDIAKKGRIVSERIVGTSEDTIFNIYALDGARISYINKCFYHYRKTNTTSITASYKPDLAEKWDVMYNIIQEYIAGSGRADEYRTPFLNRVACGMIGLGLNEIGSPDSSFAKSKRLGTILDKPLYRQAFAQLDTKYCDMKWKFFFMLCKKRRTFALTILLQIMNYLRSRVTA